MALNNFIGKRKWKSQFEAGVEAFNSGDFATAEASLSTALEHASGISEKDDSYGVTALLLGQVFRRTDRYAEADEMSKKAFDYYESVFGVTDPRSVKAHMAIVLARPERSHFNLDVRKATFELARGEFGPASWQAVRTAALALESFTPQEREYISDEVKEACTAIVGADRVNLATWPPVAEEFADGLAGIGENEQAARFMGLQLKMNEERFGKKSQEAAIVRLKMGELFMKTGEPEKAEISFSRAIEIIRLKLGPKSEQVQSATVSLARAMVRQKKLAEAVPYLNEALVTLRPNQITERIEVLLGLLEYKCLVAGSDSERGALWQELEAFWERAEEDETRRDIFEGLLSAQQRLQQAWELRAADRFLHAVLARVRQWRGANHPDVARVLMELAACAIGADDRKKADTFMEQSLAIDEEPDNLIRAVRNLARMGEWQKARDSANRATRLMNIEPRGVINGRREARLAEAMLMAGELDLAYIYAENAEAQLPNSEHHSQLGTRARVKVLQGEWDEADRFFSAAVKTATDPYESALLHLHRAWVLVQSSDFTLAKDSLQNTQTLAQLRPEHPVCYQVKAVEAQMAFYRGNMFEGKELRGKVLSFLRDNGHKHTTRGLEVLSLLDPFGPEEHEEEWNLGQEILAVSDFPVRFYYVFPALDIANIGLRHVVRALYFQGKESQAQERLKQYEERFFSQHDQSNPNAGNLHLTATQVIDDATQRVGPLESAVDALSALSSRHVALFATLNRLAKTHMELGHVEKALEVCRQALAIRQSSRVQEWISHLERGEIPPSERKSIESTDSQSTELPVEESVEPSAEPSTEPSAEPSSEAPGESSGEEEAVEDWIEPEEESEESVEAAPVQPIAALGTTDVSEIPLAKILLERDDPPSEDEVEEFIAEVQARFGDNPSAHREGRVLLALLFDDGAALAEELWYEALEFANDESSLYALEFRARDASRPTLVVQTLNEQLRRENERFGENSADTLNTQMKLAAALEATGDLHDAYRRLTMVTEILRSWFGARSRRLLEPLGELMRVAEHLSDTQAAFEHQLDRHRILEAGDADSEELFYSRISLLPLRARLGQMDELLRDVEECEKELVGFRPQAATEFARTLLVAARRADQLHWRADVSAAILETALRILPDHEVKLGCALRVMLSEGLYRKDYRSQATRVRGEAVDMAGTLEPDERAEMYHFAAQSCIRLGEIDIARALAERVLEERIAEEGRKDIWAGRALLVLAEADLLTFRLEGTETEIGMSAPSLKGTRFWGKALSLKLQALYFLGRYEEAFELFSEIPEERRLSLQLKLAVWRGEGHHFVQRITSEKPTLLAEQWADFESLPLEPAVNMLEFFARAGQTGLLARGLTRIWNRITDILPTDVRHARLQVLGAGMQFWETDYEGAANTLLRALDLFHPEAIVFPEGLVSGAARELLLSCLLLDGRATSALSQAQQTASETAEMLGEEDVRAIAVKVRLAQCARALGSHDDALVLLDEILTPLQDHLGETHVILREVYHGLARTFLDQGDLDSARLSAEEALRIDKECRGLSIHFVEDLELLADIEQAEDVPEALNLLDTALELAEQILPKNHRYAALLEQKRSGMEGLEDAPTPSATTLSVEERESEEDSAEQLFEVDPPAEPEVAEAEDEVEEESSQEPEESEDEAEELAEAEDELEEPEEEEVEAEDSAEVEEEVAEAEEQVDESVEAEESGESTLDSAEQLFVIDSDEFEEAPSTESESSPEALETLFAIDTEVVSESDEAAEEPAEAEEELELSDEEAEELAEAENELEESEEDEEEAEELAEAEDELEESDEDEEEAEELAEAEDELEESDEDEEDPEELAEAEDELEESDEDEEEAEELAEAEDELEESDEDEEDAEELAEAEDELEESDEDEEEAEELAEAEDELEESDEDEEEAEELAEAEDELEESDEDEEEAEELAEAEDELEESDEDEEDAEEIAEAEDELEEPEDSFEAPETSGEMPYRTAARARTGAFAPSSASVEGEYDFPEVPLRLPHIDDLAESEEAEPQLVARQDIEIEYAGEIENYEEVAEVSVEQVLKVTDPESYLMPLAPVFFLPVPWKEATEAAFDTRFEELYTRFQQAYKKGVGWREIVEEAVSAVRCQPSHESGYFLFLLGAQLEKSGNLHTADVCLATAIEFLDVGEPLGAACHLAGRVAGRRGELKRALEYLERAAELAGEAELAVLKIDAAECHLGMGRPEEALLGFEEVFGYLAENAPKVQALAIQAKMAQIHLLIGDPDTSLALAEKTREALSPKNVGTYRVLGRILLSRAYARLGRHELALELAEKAWEGAEPWSAKRKEGRRIAICNLVDIYCVMGHFEKAREMIANTGLTGYGLAEAELLLRAGHIDCALGNHANARRYMQLGRSFLTRFRSPALWRSCFHELEAELFLAEADYKKADAASSKALEVFEREATGPVDRSRHIVRWAKIAAALGDFRRARQLVEQAHSLRDLHLGPEHPHTSSVEGLTAVLSGG